MNEIAFAGYIIGTYGAETWNRGMGIGFFIILPLFAMCFVSYPLAILSALKTITDRDKN